jgi:PAS domain S-box-containing protein
LSFHKEAGRRLAVTKLKKGQRAIRERSNRASANAVDNAAQEFLQKLTHDLGERVKELNCLYGISNLAERQGISLEETIKGILDLIPPAWQYPDITCARIFLEGREFRTENFRETAWKQASDINVQGKRIGTLEVCYLEEKPEMEEGPFLKEERNTINAIAEQSGRIVERNLAEEALRESERDLAIRNRISNILLTVPDDEMYGEVLQVVLEAMESRYGVFGYIDENEALVSPSMTRDIWEQCQVPDKTIVFPRESWGGIWGRALIEKKSLYANGGLRVPEGHISIQRVLVVPIMYHGNTIGLLEVANKATDYNEKDQRFLETIADHIAPVLHARLQRETQERTRKEAEEQLRLQIQFIDSAIDALMDTFFVFSPENGKARRWNKAFRDISGYSDEEIGRLKVPDSYYGQEDLEKAAAATQAVFEEGIATVELSLISKDGKRVPFEYSEGLIESPEGKPWVCAIGRNLSERKQAEEALLRQRDNLVSIMEAMEDGIYIANRQYGIEYTNLALRKEFGPVEGKKCYEYFHDRNQPCPWCRNEEVFAGKTIRREWYSPKNQKMYDLIDAPVKNPDGSVSNLVILRDITERKRMDQLKDEFIGLVSHELRSPLTVVIGAVSTALTELERLSPEETRQLLQDASSEADSLSHLLGNLLELSRVQADRLFLHVEPISIESAIQNTVEGIRQQSPTCQFVIDLPKRLPLVPADQLRVERILYNLLENAVKYSPQGSEVRIFVKPEKERLVIGVSDQGMGISAEDQAKIFGLFQRLEDSAAAGVKGLGLGLLVCRRLVEAHGGRIWVESEPGQGSTFFFTLPFGHTSP